MLEITCINVANYPNALTRGKRYELLEISENQEQVRLYGDNNRKRWYPANLFDFENRLVPMLELFCLDDLELSDNPFNSDMEVTVKLSTGELRWCLFSTPNFLAQSGNFVPGTQARFHYNMPHLIVINQITPEIIEKTLRYIDTQNKLIACTLRLDPDNA